MIIGSVNMNGISHNYLDIFLTPEQLMQLENTDLEGKVIKVWSPFQHLRLLDTKVRIVNEDEVKKNLDALQRPYSPVKENGDDLKIRLTQKRYSEAKESKPENGYHQIQFLI